MKMMDINKKFSEKVAKYLVEGYIINTRTMRGHQGEEGKIDLVKGNHLIRVWLESASAAWDKEDWEGWKLILRVSEWIYEFDENVDVVWSMDLNHLEEITYYEVERGQWYIDNLEEALIIQAKKRKRTILSFSMYHNTEDITSQEAKEICSRYLKRKIGYKRVNMDDIIIKKRADRDYCYTMYYRGNSYNFH